MTSDFPRGTIWLLAYFMKRYIGGRKLVLVVPVMNSGRREFLSPSHTCIPSLQNAEAQRRRAVQNLSPVAVKSKTL